MGRVVKIIIFLCLTIGPLLVAKLMERSNTADSSPPGAASAAAASPAQRMARLTDADHRDADHRDATGPASKPASSEERPEHRSPVQPARSVREASPPLGLPVTLVHTCEVSVDHVDGQPPTAEIRIGGDNTVSLDGWATVSGRDGTVPDEVYVTLSGNNGDTAYFRANRVPRPDLKSYFAQPNLPDAGFTAAIDTSALGDRLTLGIARQIGSRIERCQNISLALYRGNAPAANSGPTSRRESSPPSGLPVVTVESCEGNIDLVNGDRPATLNPINGDNNSLSLAGWTTLSGKDGTVPDKVYVTLSDAHDDPAYFTTQRVSRPDLKAYFGRQDLPNAGFTANIDASGLADRLVLGVARETGGRIERCGNFAFLLFRAKNQRVGSPPMGLPVSTVKTCEGSFDHVDNKPVAPDTRIEGRRSVGFDGWMTLSGKSGTVPDQVYVTLSGDGGDVAYFGSTRIPRPDLKAHFAAPNLPDAGFAAIVDMSGFRGKLTAGLARQTGGRIERCQNLTLSLYRDAAPPPAAAAVRQ